jgi:hypothetical protein
MSHNNPSIRFWMEDLNHKLDRVLGIDPVEDPPLPMVTPRPPQCPNLRFPAVRRSGRKTSPTSPG